MKRDNREQTGIAIGAAVGFTVGVLVIGFNFPWLAVGIAVGALLGGGVAHVISKRSK